MMFKAKDKDKDKDRENQKHEPKQDAGIQDDALDVKALQAEVAVLRKEIEKRDDFQDRFLRLQAEFDNFRKRSLKERQEFIKYANEGLILELVGMLDNFERSIKAADSKQDFKLLHQGVDMISKQLHKLLEEKGLKKIICKGEKFNPNMHEAMEAIESEDADEGCILEEFQPGYILNDRVIRPAMVKVAKCKKADSPPVAQNEGTVCDSDEGADNKPDSKGLEAGQDSGNEESGDKTK
jgi:molecular chaperone GrpE